MFFIHSLWHPLLLLMDMALWTFICSIYIYWAPLCARQCSRHGDTVLKRKGYDHYPSGERCKLSESQFWCRVNCARTCIWMEGSPERSEAGGGGEDGSKRMLHVLRPVQSDLVMFSFCSCRPKPRKYCRSCAMYRKYFTRGKWVWWNWQPDRLAQCNLWPLILSPPQNGCHQKPVSPSPWVGYLGKEALCSYVS